jgi:hypothetical protein
MTTLDTLRLEMANDPEGLGYSGMSDPEVADALNAPSRQALGTVAASEVRRFVLLNGIWPSIANAAQGHADPTVRGTAVTILQTLAPNSFDQIRMGDSQVYNAVSQMLATLVSGGVMTADQRDAMIALGTVSISRATELGLPHISHVDVGMARLAIEGDA